LCRSECLPCASGRRISPCWSAFSRRICEKNHLKPKTLEEDVVWELQRYRWPGNVRELQNVLERNVSQSALELGVRRTYLHRRMAVLKINKKDYFV
jgi:transcriptional regulator with PAS, ATPase and Fis domain